MHINSFEDSSQISSILTRFVVANRLSVSVKELVEIKVKEKKKELQYKDSIGRSALDTEKFREYIDSIVRGISSELKDDAPDVDTKEMKEYVTSSEQFSHIDGYIEKAVEKARNTYSDDQASTKTSSFLSENVALCKDALSCRPIKGNTSVLLSPLTRLHEFVAKSLAGEYADKITDSERYIIENKIKKRVDTIARFYMKFFDDPNFVNKVSSIEVIEDRFKAITPEYGDNKIENLLDAIEDQVDHCFDNIQNSTMLSEKSKKTYADLLNAEILNRAGDALLRIYISKISGLDDSISPTTLVGIDDIVCRYDWMFAPKSR